MTANRRHRMRTTSVLIYSAFSCIGYVNAGIWKPVAALWPGNLVQSENEVSDKARGNSDQWLSTTQDIFSQIEKKDEKKNQRGWFGRKQRDVSSEKAGQDLIEEATQLIIKRQEAIQEEAAKVMQQIENIASEKSQAMQKELIDHANQRQQQLAEEVEKLSEWTERLLEDRANRVEAHARATLLALDRAAVEEGRRLKMMGMALAEKTMGQAEQKALEGLSALEQNAIDQVVKLGAHIVESITKGKKKKETPSAILQRQLLGKDGSGRLKAWVRSSAVFLAILLSISPPYWDRIGGNSGIRSVVPGNIASLLFQNPNAIRPLAAAVCALSAVLLTFRFPSDRQKMLERAGSLLLFIICRFQTFETTLMSLAAIAFLLSEHKIETRK